MSITNSIELQQGIANLQERLEVPVRFLTKEDLTSLVNFLSDTSTYLYNVITSTFGISENITILTTLYDNLLVIQDAVTFITENNLSININIISGSISSINSVALALVNINNVAANLTAINNAITYATTATTQAGIATIKAGEASTSATNANNSFINFDKRYLGAKTSNPTFDNEGVALTVGALYYNTTIPENRVYTGSAWVTAYSASSSGITSIGLSVPTGLTVTGSPLTANGSLAITLTSGYSIPSTTSQSNWDTAYTDRNKWDGGNTGLVAATGRTSLGATTIGSNIFTLTNPSAITFPRFNSDNTISALDASSFRTAIGAGTSSTTGTVTSVGLSLPSEITISNSPVSGTGTLTGVWTSQTAKYFFAAPNGSAGTPSFRAILASDIPTLNQNTSGSAASVTNATFTTALTVNTGTVTLTGNVANTSVLTIGAGAVLVSGSNTGDQTNISGNAATVTTNANLTGEITSVGNTTTVTNSAVIGKLLTGYTSGAGTVATTDTILGAIQKLNGNNVSHAGLTTTAHGGLLQIGTTGTTACAGNDSRLSDSRTASDVSAWAKAGTKPTYTYSEVGAQVAGSYPTGSGTCSGTNTGDQTNITGNAATASTANALNTANSYQVVNLTSTGRIALANGTAALPSLYFASDGAYDTGLYWGGDGIINFTNNGVYSGKIEANHNLTMVGAISGSNLSGINTGDQIGGTPALTFSTTNTAGASANFLRRDDTIAIFDTSDPATQAFGVTTIVGTAPFAARRDHRHAMPAQPTGGDATNNIGYLNIPQNSQSTNYTLVIGDAGKHIYHPSADTTARTWTIPANSSVAYPIGTAITFVNDTNGGIITIAITTDTMVLSGTGTTGSRTLAANGNATAIKVTSTRWQISGVGLT